MVINCLLCEYNFYNSMTGITWSFINLMDCLIHPRNQTCFPKPYVLLREYTHSHLIIIAKMPLTYQFFTHCIRPCWEYLFLRNKLLDQDIYFHEGSNKLINLTLQISNFHLPIFSIVLCLVLHILLPLLFFRFPFFGWVFIWKFQTILVHF